MLLIIVIGVGVISPSFLHEEACPAVSSRQHQSNYPVWACKLGS